MAAVKDVLRHVSAEVAGRKRKCYRKPNAHVITKGDPCLVVRDGPQQQRTYCVDCAREILDKAQARLDKLVDAVVSE
jgi:hypothetical protein